MEKVRDFEASEQIGLLLVGFSIYESVYGKWQPYLSGVSMGENEFNGIRAGIVVALCFLSVNALFSQRIWEPAFWKIWSSYIKVGRNINRSVISEEVKSVKYILLSSYIAIFISSLLYISSVALSFLFLGNRQAFLLLLGYFFVFVQIGFNHDLEIFHKSGRFPRP